MTRKRTPRRARKEATSFDRARDELFSAIRQCGVMEAHQEEREEWMNETLGYMAERHPDLTPTELDQLKSTGLHFCGPVIPHGKHHTALSLEGMNVA